MSLTVGDVIFSRTGDPVTVKAKEESTNAIILDESRSLVRAKTGHGIKNGLVEADKEVFDQVMLSLSDKDRRKEIDELHAKIQDLKASNANPRVLRYLESELAHRILKERYHPPDYAVDPFTVGV